MPDGVVVEPSLARALEYAREAGESEVFVVGGALLYQEALAIARRAVVTLVEGEATGDVYFPEVDWREWTEVARERVPRGERDERNFEVVEYRREGAALSSNP